MLPPPACLPAERKGALEAEVEQKAAAIASLEGAPLPAPSVLLLDDMLEVAI